MSGFFFLSLFSLVKLIDFNLLGNNFSGIIFDDLGFLYNFSLVLLDLLYNLLGGDIFVEISNF